MKLVMFEDFERQVVAPGVLLKDGVVTLEGLVAPAAPNEQMLALLRSFDVLRAQIEDLLNVAAPVALAAGALHAPISRPGKVLGCIANYWEHAQREARPLNMFLKNPDAVIGPGDKVILPEWDEPYAFMHEAELGIVLKGPAKSVSADDWRNAVVGYTAVVDVSARAHGRSTWRDGSWLGKSFDTFCPLGPAIVTADEIADPNDLIVKFWVDGVLRHFYSTSDMEHWVPELVEFASRVMTLNTGDIISCGTNHEGLGFIQDGEHLKIEIEHIGPMELDVVDPLRRSWDKGIYMGVDSTNHAAVRRHRPGDASGLAASINPEER